MTRPPEAELLALLRSTVAREGTTTGAGAVTGDSIIDAALIGVGADSFLTMLIVLYPGNFSLVDSADITAFNNVTGEVTFSTAYKGVAAALPAGVPYQIVTFRFVPAEVAALTALVTDLMADVGDASAATLGSILGILGDPAQTFLAMIGYEGATSLADKLTAARAALIDQITAARMQELDGANIPADIDTLLTRLSAVRAGYLDELAAANLPTDIAALATSQGRMRFSFDYWSDMQEEVVVTGAQTTPGLPSVTIADLPAGATIVRAIAIFKFRMVENTYAGVNKLSAAAVLPIQVKEAGAGAWTTAIDFVDDAFTLADTAREGGDAIIGDNDIASEVDGNDTYSFQWLNAKADSNNLQFNDVQVGLRIWYSV